MIEKIIRSPVSIKKRLKRIILYLSRRKGVKKSWDQRHKIVFQQHPEFNLSLPNTVLKKHRATWKPFNKSFSNKTLKICSSISGSFNPWIIPEEVYQTDIEPSLNRYSEAQYLAHKSFYNRWFKSGIFPEDLLHVVDGEILNANYNPISLSLADSACESFEYPVIAKPNIDTWGGSNVSFLDSPESVRKILRETNNVVIQNKVLQHSELSRYHEKSLNTIRVYLYKSVVDNRVNIINTVFRTGNGGYLDNVALGGLVSLIKEDGSLHGYALDRYGKKYLSHPVSGMLFNGAIPEFGKMKKLSKQIAQKLYLLRVVGLDLCYDISGNWRVIEVNTTGHSIRFAQYAGQPFFGEFTEEVIEYCKENHWALTV